jgi:predicted nucleic acid-binding protein
MKPIFADTSFYVALCGKNDRYHAQALAVSSDITARIITTEYVLVETGGLLLRPEDRPSYLRLVQELKSDATVEIVPASESLFELGFDLFGRRADKFWSMVDCISFVVMKQRRLKEALTTDHHFVQAGFRSLILELTD